MDDREQQGGDDDDIMNEIIQMSKNKHEEQETHTLLKIRFERGHVFPIGYKKLKSQRAQESSQTLQLIIRVVFVTIVVALMATVSWLTKDQKKDNVEGIVDKGHDWTTGLNEHFRNNVTFRRAIFITCGLLMDFLQLL